MNNQIKIRLSDGYSWAHEFNVTGINSLRTGCISAWAEYNGHLNSLIDVIPPYQTIKRDKQAMANKNRQGLQLHVKDPTMKSYWVSSSYCNNPFKCKNDWDKIWNQVIGSDNHIAELNLFCDSMSEFVADTTKPQKQKLTIINGGNNNGR